MSPAVKPRPTSTPTADPHSSGFVASQTLSTNLQLVLGDLIELHLQGKQAHWNIVGTNFRDLHLLLDEIVGAAREASDTIAERMRALRSAPDGSSETVTTTTSLLPFPSGQVTTATAVRLISQRLTAVAARARAVHHEVDSEDPTSADLLHAVIESMEKYACS
jgi:starvation-inducible DNA-binding protein